MNKLNKLFRLLSTLIILTYFGSEAGAQAVAQYDTTKNTKVAGYGYTWMSSFSRYANVIPKDTTNNKIVGSIAILNDTFYIKTTNKWEKVAGGGGGGISEFVYASEFFEDIPILGRQVTGDGTNVTFVSNNTDAPILGTTVYGVINDYTQKVSTYTEVTRVYADSAGRTVIRPMVDSLVDGFVLRKKEGHYYKLNFDQWTPQLFGAKADNTHDDREAILKAIRLAPRQFDVGTTQPSPGAMVYFKAGQYFCSDSIGITRTTHLYGEGGSLSSNTQIIFAQNKSGFDVFRFATKFADTSGVAISYRHPRAADGTIFENLSILQRDPSIRGVGIQMRVEAEIQNCNVSGWAGMNVFVVANPGATTGFFGIKHIYVTNPGTTNYTTAPTATVVPGPGWVTGSTLPTLHTVLGGGIGNARVADSGAGYEFEPNVIEAQAEALNEANIQIKGWGAVVHAWMGIKTIIVDSGGQNYTHAEVTFTSPVGHDATGHVVVSGGAVVGIVIDEPGLEYPQIATTGVHITGDGTGAHAYTSELKVAKFVIQSRGKQYEADDLPLLLCVGGRRGTGHDAIGAVDSITARKLKRVVIDNLGTNVFHTTPTITIAGGGGTGGQAMITRNTDEVGNANRWKIIDTKMNSGGWGLYVTGTDVNAGGAERCDVSDNEMYGAVDNSFLGNTYIGLHANGNGLGAYASYQNTANNYYLNCYSEGNQPPSVGLSPARFQDGVFGSGVKGSAIVGPELSRGKVTAEGVTDGALFGDLGANELLRFRGANSDVAGDMRWHWGQETSDQWMDWYNSFSRLAWYITGTESKAHFGKPNPTLYSMYINKLFVGSDTGKARQITTSPVFPPFGSNFQGGWGKGDFVFNSNPTVTGTEPNLSYTLGWVRLRQGTGNVLGTDWFEVIVRQGDYATEASVDLKANLSATINTKTASYVLVLGDAGELIRMNVGSANTVTVPPNSSVAFPIGTQLVVSQAGAGQVTVVAGAGVTINSAGGALKTRLQHSALTLIKTLSDTWLCSGDITTVTQ